MVKIIASLRNLYDRIRTSISIKARNVLFFIAIFLIVVLAILIRISPILRGPNIIKAFDPWIQWYNAEYLSTHSIYEYFNWHDFKSWYPQGQYRGDLRPGLTFTVVIIYKIIRFFGIPVSLYDVCYFFPAFMGGITVLTIYYLGKEINDRGTGLVAAFFLAFNPGYMQRTMAGFFDNETIGVFASLMCFLFWLKAIKTGKLSFSIIGGIFLGYLSLSWGGYQFVYLIIPLISIILMFIDKYNQNVLIAYAGVEGTGLLIFSLFISYNYNNLFSSLTTGGLILFTVILVFFQIIQSKKNEYPRFYQGLINFLKWIFIPVVIIAAVILWVAPDILPFGFGSRFQTILNPLFREKIALVASVAEQMPSSWSVFYYNTLIPLILIPLGFYFCFKRLIAPDIFLITFLLLMFYFTGSMIRIILIFAPAAALMGAYGLVSVLKIFGSFLGERRVGVSRKRKRQLKGTIGNSEILAIYIIVGFLGIAQIVHSTDISINQFSYSQMVPAGAITDWQESLSWMRSNLKGTDVVVSWWDYGYWLTPVGNVTTVNDNMTRNSTRIGLTGMALMQTNEIYSAKVFRRLKADYVLVYFGFLLTGLGGDEGKWNWMVRICNDHYAKYKKWGMEEDNWKEDAVFDESEFQNATDGKLGPLWFQSQLAKLMFYGQTTNIEEYGEGDFRRNYPQQITTRETTDGKVWKDYIPDNGNYDFKVFIPTYISKFGLVKLYKVDYTALESKFIIKDPAVFTNGYATFEMKNTGTKDLLINKVEINGEEYPFLMSSGISNNTVESGESETVFVNLKLDGKTFEKDDVVHIDVTAQSEALEGKQYEFTNSTSNFFVKEGEKGAIKINKKNSKVIQINSTSTDVLLEVENVGKTIEILERFYVNNDTESLRFPYSSIEYLSGSSILKPGEKAKIYLKNANASFYSEDKPLSKSNKIGVATTNNVHDELLFTSNDENFKLSILSEERIVSPELSLISDSYYRKHIPISFSHTHAYTYENGTTNIEINIKNTGDIIFGIDAIYLTESLYKVNFHDYYVKSGDYNLEKGEEETIVVDATNTFTKNDITLDVNDELLICVTGSFVGDTVASDIGYIYTTKNEADIKIIDSVEGNRTSFIYANETGKLLIKNTGNEKITLGDIYLNKTLATNVEYLYGNDTLDIQECAIVSFDIPDLKINESNAVTVNVTTSSPIAKAIDTLYGYVDPKYYNITIINSGTTAFEDGNLTILIKNQGQFDVNIDAVYINSSTYGSYISLDSFFETSFNITAGSSFQLTLSRTTLQDKLGKTLTTGDKLEILVRTKEGAEFTHIETVK
ncbi:MAG: STT3 domain-containing protein [Promethearchaeota archaeon]